MLFDNFTKFNIVILDREFYSVEDFLDWEVTFVLFYCAEAVGPPQG